jgi:hypothetical protein
MHDSSQERMQVYVTKHTSPALTEFVASCFVLEIERILGIDEKLLNMHHCLLMSLETADRRNLNMVWMRTE